VVRNELAEPVAKLIVMAGGSAPTRAGIDFSRSVRLNHQFSSSLKCWAIKYCSRGLLAFTERAPSNASTLNRNRPTAGVTWSNSPGQLSS